MKINIKLINKSNISITDNQLNEMLGKLTLEKLIYLNHT